MRWLVVGPLDDKLTDQLADYALQMDPDLKVKSCPKDPSPLTAEEEEAFNEGAWQGHGSLDALIVATVEKTA